MDQIKDTESERPIKRRRRRKHNQNLAAQIVLEPTVVTTQGYHLRPAKNALKGIEIDYEPPYESASMPVGQRSEHPEYDTGHPLASPLDFDEAAA
ncbi:MAG: hypothetical protein WAO58_07590 [Fimbriimonadaceae bacterium]